jgi:hypothetical protein
LRGGDRLGRILRKQQAVIDHPCHCGFDSRDIGLQRAIKFLDRRTWIAAGEALGAR